MSSEGIQVSHNIFRPITVAGVCVCVGGGGVRWAITQLLGNRNKESDLPGHQILRDKKQEHRIRTLTMK